MRFEAVGPRIALDLESTSYLPKNRSVRSPNLRLSSLNLQLSLSLERVSFAIYSRLSQFVSLPALCLCPHRCPFPRYRESLSNLHLVSAQLLILPRHWGPGWLEESARHTVPLYLSLPTSPLTNLTFSLRVRYFVHVHVIIPSRFRHTHPHAVLVSQPLLLRAQLSSAPPAFPSRPAGSFTSLPGTSFVSALPLSYCTYPWPPPLRGPCFSLRLVPDYVCKYYHTYIVLKHGSSTSR